MILEPREVKLSTRTGISVKRLLPHAHVRKVGAWVFVDYFGPMAQTDDSMVVAAHPHTGLQTVTWLLEGSVEHRDSLGTIQHIEPGQLNLMTAGSGIAHSELSIGKDGSRYQGNMHGVQLWVALPDSVRQQPPFFEHHAHLPKFAHQGSEIRLLVGDYLGHKAATKVFSPLLGAEITIGPSGKITLPAVAGFEHAIIALTDSAEVNGEAIEPAQATYLETDSADSIHIEAKAEAKVLLLAGEPFGEEIVMWWNFIGRSHEEIVAMRARWNEQDGWIPTINDRIGGWIPAPDLPNVTLRAR